MRDCMPGSTVGTGSTEVGPADVGLELVLDEIQPSPAHWKSHVNGIHPKSASFSHHCKQDTTAQGTGWSGAYTGLDKAS